MSDVVTKQELVDAGVDAGDLGKVMNDPANLSPVSTRLGQDIKNVAKAIAEISTYDDKGPWVTLEDYIIKDLVQEAGITYICTVPHESGTFETDKAAGKWGIFQTQTPEKHLSEYSDLAAFLAAVGSTPTSLVIDDDAPLTANLTIPSTVSRRHVNDKVILTDGFVLTDNGIINAGLERLYDTSGGGAVVGTLNNQTIYPQWWGAAVGAADNTAPIRSMALALESRGGGNTVFPPGTYVVMSSTIGTLVGISGVDGINIRGYGATIEVLTTKTVTTSEGSLFSFTNCKNVTLEGFKTNGPVLDVSQSAVKGHEFCRVQQGCKNIALRNNWVQNSALGLICARAVGDPESYRSTGISVENLFVSNCWYGCNFQRSGDDSTVRGLRTDTVHRSFTMSNVRNLSASIWSKDHKATDVPMWSTRGGTLENIDINYYSDTDSILCAAFPKVRLGFDYGDIAAGLVRNVRINLNIEFNATGSTGGCAFEIMKRAFDGSPDPTDRGHRMENVTVRGSVVGAASDGGAYGFRSIITSANATWGGGDFFKCMALENLYLEDAPVGFSLPGLLDHILLKNVSSNTTIDITQGDATTQPPSSGKVTLQNVTCTNRYERVGTSRPLNSLRATSTTDTVQVGWSGKTITTNGAGGTMTWQLPPAVIGLNYTFARTEAQLMFIDPDGTETVRGGTAGQRVSSNDSGALIKLACHTDGYWEIEWSQGTFSYS